MSPPLTKSEPNFRFLSGGDMGKFREDEGGSEGEGDPSERGLLLPPRSSPYPPTSNLHRAVEGAELDRLGNVRRTDHFAGIEIRNRPRNAENATVTPRA